ncbi:alpha-galactosidase [Amycolatopsis balhimycina]|nr:alpha-galactosidase [Amycolatopsis balhimycina]
MTFTEGNDEPAGPGVVHLAAAGTSLLLDATGDRLPRIVYWGADLGQPTEAELGDLVRAARPPVVSNSIDDPLPVGVLAEAATGWSGTPGIAGSRAGRAFSPLFTKTAVDLTADGTLITAAQDAAAGLALELRVALSPSGVVRLGATVTNIGEDAYGLDALTLNLPVPTTALELLDFSGRHLRERAPQRHPFTLGSYVRSGRRGRTGLDATLLMLAGEPGFGFRRGEVWGVHTAWSGNHTTYAERDAAGTAILAGGEILLPGEMILSPGESYACPTLLGSHGDGMDALSGRFHADLRSRLEHPGSPRPIALNTWEAVYFDHDPAKLRELAELAAQVGAERFTLDDGWFRGRRADNAGLGDWFVDEQVWPDGLRPIADHVRSLGMQFGLWVEPEMINPDSDLARTHPEWILRPDARLPPEARHQQVLDISRPDAYAYVLERLDALVTENGVGYLKWDHNRDLVDAGHTASGTAGVHDQTRALYRLLDELRAKHPGLEIESCSSGGGRADLEILARTERIWASDCLDALERQHIQRWTGLLLPPEMLGSHVGAPTAHTTGRTHTLDFRAGTAFFGHFGMEWDLTSASETELAELTAWIALHKQFRPLLHSGTVVRGDHPDPAHWLHGVVAQDRAEALFAFVALQTGAWAPPGRVRLPMLDAGTRYTVRFLSAVERPRRHGLPAFPGWADRPLTLSGAALATAGFQAPALQPEQLQLIHVIAEH